MTVKTRFGLYIDLFSGDALLIDADTSHTIVKLAKLAIVLVILFGAAHRLKLNYITPAIILIALCGAGAVVADFDGDGLNTPDEIQHDTKIFSSEYDTYTIYTNSASSVITKQAWNRGITS